MGRETKVERDIVDEVEKDGEDEGHAYKFTSPNRRGVPDRLCLRKIPKKHQAIVAKYIRFVEAKAPGETPRKDQDNEIEYIRSLGFTVEVVDYRKWKWV